MKRTIALVVLFFAVVGCGSNEEADNVADQEELTQDVCNKQHQCRGLEPEPGACQINVFDEGPCAEERYKSMKCVNTLGSCDSETKEFVDQTRACFFLWSAKEECMRKHNG